LMIEYTIGESSSLDIFIKY